MDDPSARELALARAVATIAAALPVPVTSGSDMACRPLRWTSEDGSFWYDEAADFDAPGDA